MLPPAGNCQRVQAVVMVVRNHPNLRDPRQIKRRAHLAPVYIECLRYQAVKARLERNGRKMFPALLLARGRGPVRVKTETSFTTKDPWNQNRSTPFTLEVYWQPIRGMVPKPDKKKPFLYGIRSNTDGVERLLPDSLCELWLQNRVAVETLPRLLQQMEPTLKKSDYNPMLRDWTVTFLVYFVAVMIGLAALMPILMATLTAEFSLFRGIVYALAICAFGWFLVDFRFVRERRRRRRQMQWAMAQM